MNGAPWLHSLGLPKPLVQTSETGCPSKWIASRLTPGSRNFPSLLGANSWLSKATGERRLAFSVVGFIRRRPVAIIVSNFMDINGRVFNPLPQLKSSEIKPRVPEVRFAGDMSSIREDDRKCLKETLIKSKKPSDVHTLLAEVNALCAQRCKTISSECVTGHLSPTGAADVLPHGINTKVEYVPRFVKRFFRSNGIIGFVRKKDDKGNLLPPQWVQMAAKRQGKSKKTMAVLVAHEMRTGIPVSSGTQTNDPAFWRLHGGEDRGGRENEGVPGGPQRRTVTKA